MWRVYWSLLYSCTALDLLQFFMGCKYLPYMIQLIEHEQDTSKNKYGHRYWIIFQAVVQKGAQGCDFNATVVSLIPTQRNKLWFLNKLIIISSLWHSKHNASKESTESEERSVLTQGSLCLPCWVQYTAWSWKNIYSMIRKLISKHCIRISPLII